MTNRARKAARKRFAKTARNEQALTPAFIASLPQKHVVSVEGVRLYTIY